MAEGSLARSKSIRTRTTMVTGTAEPAADDASLPRTKLNYVKAQAETTSFLGMPRLLHWNVPFTCKQIGALIHCGSMAEQHEVPLHDARAAGLSYESTGITLELLRSQVTDWSQVSKKGSAEQLKYQAELEVLVRKLHPGVKALAWSSFLLRGGPGENGPAGACGVRVGCMCMCPLARMWPRRVSRPPRSKCTCRTVHRALSDARPASTRARVSAVHPPSPSPSQRAPSIWIGSRTCRG